MFTSRKVFWIFLALLALILGACNLSSKTAVPSNNPAATLTAAYETVAAQLDPGKGGINATSTAIAATVLAQIRLTQVAAGTQVVEPSAIATLPEVPPTSTSVPPTPVPPTSTTVPPTPVPPTATQPQIPCDRAKFVEDVTSPDGTDVIQGTSFVKTWRLKNNGICTWNSS